MILTYILLESFKRLCCHLHYKCELRETERSTESVCRFIAVWYMHLI